MATPRYRVIDEKGAYLPRSPEPQLLQLGADHQAARIYGIRAPVCELLSAGAEIEYLGVPGPHLEPLNDEARAAMAAYWEAHPNASLDPTRHLPLGRDPIGGRTVEQLVSGLLEAMDREASVARERADAARAGGAQAAQLDALVQGQVALQDALRVMAAALASAPSHAGKGRAV